MNAACLPSEPRVPRRVHATQIVQTVRCSHQSVDLTLPSLELSQIVEAGDNGRYRLLYQGHQLLGVHVLWLSGWRQGDGSVLLGFLVPCYDLVTKHSLQDSIHLWR